MTRRPTVEKWFIDRHARLAGEIVRLEKVMTELARTLTKRRADLEALDRAMVQFDAGLVPEELPVIDGRKGRYGKRGKLRDRVLALIREASPEEITTPELAARLAAEFDLHFPTPAKYRDWMTDTLLPQLRRLAKEGLIRRLHDPLLRGETGRWQDATASEGMDQLRRLVADTGVETVFRKC